MFELINQEELAQLTTIHDGPCVSIYIPNLNENAIQIEFDALARRAVHLLNFESRIDLRDNLLKSIHSFKPAEYITAQDKGLALFVNKHIQKYYVTGYELPSKTVVADSFHLKPLIDELQFNRNYNILVISMEEAILMQVDSGKSNILHNFLFQIGTQKISIHWKHFEESDTAQIPHPTARLRGRGIHDDNYKRKSIKLFLKWIEAKINKEEHYKSTPLYIFSTEPLFQIYKSVTTHPQPILCPMDNTVGIPRTEHLIHEGNLRVQKRIQKQKMAALETAKILSRGQGVVDDLNKITKAALGGKIKTLFIRDNVEIWAELHRKNGEFSIHEKQLNSHDDDILDDIACEVIRHGGEVIVLSGKEMPTASPASAILNA